MSEQVGGPFQWQRLVRLVANGSLTLGGFPGTPTESNTVEVEFGNQPEIAPDDTPDLPNAPKLPGHAFYLPSVICSDDDVTCYVQGPGLLGVQFDPDGIVVSVFRRFIPGAAPRWRSGLRFVNFTSTTRTVRYRVYRLFGLI